MTSKVVLATLMLVGLCCFGLQAATISGSFDLTGTVTVTGNSITWTSSGGVDTALISNATGSFSGLNNTFASIANLLNPPEAVGVPLADSSFVGFMANPGLGVLDLNFIFAGVDGAAGCASNPPAAGQVCTPTITQNGSTVPGPFNMQNIAGTGGPQATITWAFAGDALSGGSVGGTWEGNFTSQENVPFQTILAQLASNGSATNSFSEATLVVTVSTVPEGGTFALVGLGLVVLSRGLSRLRKKIHA